MWWKLWFSSRLTARAQAASNLKSPKALDLTLFAAAVRSLSSLTCYPLTTARDSPLQDFPCLTAYCINPSNSFRERKICISRTGLLAGLICDVRICERIKTGLMGHRSAWHHVSCRVAKISLAFQERWRFELSDSSSDQLILSHWGTICLFQKHQQFEMVRALLLTWGTSPSDSLWPNLFTNNCTLSTAWLC